MKLITNRSLIEAVDQLYFSGSTPKRGAATGKRPGTLRRLIAVIEQFDLTYDLYAMKADEIVPLLAAEFDRWREPQRN